MKQLKLILLTLAMFASAVVPVAAQTSEAAKKRAAELLIKARSASGGDEKIKAVKSLSLAGKFRRDSAVGKVGGRVEFDFLFPDKFINTERLNLPIGTITVVSAIDGEIAWQSTSSSNENIKFAGFTQKDIDDRKRLLSIAANKWVLGLLLRAPGWSSLEFAYAGKAEMDGKLVNLIDVKGTDGFSARLFLDKTTDRLTMVSYTEKLVDNKTTKIGQDGSALDGGTVPVVDGIKPGEVRMRFADYRAIDGIQLPHRITFQSGDGSEEEWELTDIRLDVPLMPDVFKEKL